MSDYHIDRHMIMMIIIMTDHDEEEQEAIMDLITILIAKSIRLPYT